MLHNFFMSYYGYLINGLHLKPLFVGFANTLFALAIIVIFTMIVVGIKKIYKAHDPVYEIGYNIVLLAVVVLAHTYLLSYITNLLPNNYVVVPEKNYFFSWAVIIGLYVYLYFTGKKSKPRVERIKKESAEGYGTLLSELK
ncbi:hypothetical protein J734_4127, partial [Acinetobacter baumannii 24860_1]